MITARSSVLFLGIILDIKTDYFLHTCTICSKLPSIISTIVLSSHLLFFLSLLSFSHPLAPLYIQNHTLYSKLTH